MHKKSLVIYDENSKWWTSEKNLDWAVQDKKGDWWLVAGSEFEEKKIEKNKNKNKIFNVSKKNDYRLVSCLLAAALGVSLAVNVFLLFF